MDCAARILASIITMIKALATHGQVFSFAPQNFRSHYMIIIASKDRKSDAVDGGVTSVGKPGREGHTGPGRDAGRSVSCDMCRSGRFEPGR